MTTRTITLAYDRDCRLGREPLIWGAAEGDDDGAALDDAAATISEGNPSDADRGERLARTLTTVQVLWPASRPLPTGQDSAALQLAAEACV